jgi:copper chaperone CopZ
MNSNTLTNTLKFIAINAIFSGAIGHMNAASAAESVKATVNGMVCAFCAQGIEKGLTALPSTKAVFVDLKNKVVAVESKDGQKPDLQAIRHEITEAGFDVVKLEAVPRSVAEIRADFKGKK